MSTKEQIGDAIMFVSLHDALMAYDHGMFMTEIKLTVPAGLLINLGPKDAKDPSEIITPLVKAALAGGINEIKEKYKGKEGELQKVIDDILEKYKKTSIGGVMDFSNLINGE